MDSEFEINFEPEEADSRAEVPSGFLEAFGLVNRAVNPVAVEAGAEEEEGLVLSSMPEDLEFPEVRIESDRAVGVSVSVSRSSLLPDSSGKPLVMEVPAIVEPAVAEELPSIESADASVAGASAEVLTDESAEHCLCEDDPENLNLECPGCGGGLVLKRQHIGIEGLCVWCRTPIVAAESARDGQVRVFPIFEGDPGAMPKVAETKPLEKTEEPVVEAPVEVDESPDKTTTTDAPASFSEPDEVTAPSLEVPVVEAPVLDAPVIPSLKVEEPAAPEGLAPMAPLDLESLYHVGGFIAPSEPTPEPAPAPEPPAPAVGFAFKIPASNTTAVPAKASDAVAPVQGFGDFLQTPAPEPSTDAVAEDAFNVPAPWGPPTRPAVEAPKAKPAKEAVPQAGFTAPPLFPESADDVPSEIRGEVPIGFSQGFGDTIRKAVEENPSKDFGIPDSAATRAFSVGSSDDDAPAPLGFGASAPNPGFGSSFGQPQRNDSATNLFAETIAAAPLPWTSQPEPAAPAPASFLDSRSLDEAPASLPSAPEEDPLASHFGSGDAGTSVPSFLPEPELFADEPAAKAESPLITPVPIVTSQSLGKKPKPKVRKGFLVLMVVLLGFASGAALASYVLPVDQYVQQARAYMEKKFGTAPAKTTLPASAQPAAAVAPAQPQS